MTRHLPLQPVLPPNATVKIIGLGGVGGIVARYGAIFLASLASGSSVRLVLIDGDRFETANSARMFFAKEGNKAAVLREELLPHVANSPLSLIAVEEFVTPQNIARLIGQREIVILAVDNHATRKLISDHCRDHLRDVCLISGGNDGVGPDRSGRVLSGTYGNVQAYRRRAGRDVTASLARYHPEIEHPADHLPTELSCTELAAHVPQIVFANLMAASVLLNTLWLHLCGALHYSEVAFDIAEARMHPVPLPSPGPVSPHPQRRRRP